MEPTPGWIQAIPDGDGELQHLILDLRLDSTWKFTIYNCLSWVPYNNAFLLAICNAFWPTAVVAKLFQFSPEKTRDHEINLPHQSFVRGYLVFLTKICEQLYCYGNLSCPENGCTYNASCSNATLNQCETTNLTLKSLTAALKMHVPYLFISMKLDCFIDPSMNDL